MKKINVGIIGTGNIGCDLLMKIQKSQFLNCSLFMGRRADSKGMQLAKNIGINISDKSINALIEKPELCDIIFDATTVKSHIEHAPILKEMGKYTIDLTPSLVGKMCVPSVNGEECLDVDNINMITCGGQGTIPMIHAICNIQKGVKYIEIVATIASKSAGQGTRANIDEFTQTTKNAIKMFSNVNSAKAIIILNPANPSIMMNNTIYMMVKSPDMEKIKKRVEEVEKILQSYIPGYKIIIPPLYSDDILTMSIQVKGAGDYLEKFSGNLDIITCASVNMAEKYAQRRI